MVLVTEMNYSEIMRLLRTEKGLTQEQLARILKINRVQYNQYENDYNTIPIKHLNSVANYFNVAVDYILGFTQQKHKIKSREIDSREAGKRLKEFRKENKLTQDKLAKILNTNQSVIANYERGRNIIATPFLYTICSKYKISADYLLGRTDEKITFIDFNN